MSNQCETDFLHAKIEYEGTLAQVAGTGTYGQHYIETAHEKMVVAHGKMTEADRAKHVLVGKEKTYQDEGNAGITSGVAAQFTSVSDCGVQ